MPYLVLEVNDDPQPKLTMRTEIGRWVPQAWATDLLKLESSVYGFDPQTFPPFGSELITSEPQSMVMVDAVKSRSSRPQAFAIGATGGVGDGGGEGLGGGGVWQTYLL